MLRSQASTDTSPPSASINAEDVEWWVRVLASSPASQSLSADTVHQLAEALQVASTSEAVANPILQRPSNLCPHCSLPMTACPDAAVQAGLLDITGWLPHKHIPWRCRRVACPGMQRRVWYNFHSRDRQREFCGPLSELNAFMLNTHFGCTLRLLQQLHLRMVREQVSFSGEAAVMHWYTSRALGSRIPYTLDRLRTYLSETWYLWRLAFRVEELKQTDYGADTAGLSLDLNLSPEANLASWWPLLKKHFHAKTAAAVRAEHHKTSVMVFDTNQKNRRLQCAAPFQNTIWHKGLGKCVHTNCTGTPMLGNIFCSRHDDWSSASDTIPSQDFEIISHELDDSANIRLKIRSVDGREAWIDQHLVDPQTVKAYFASVGEQKLLKAAQKRLGRQRRDSAWRTYVQQRMASLAPDWGTLSEEERLASMPASSSKEDLESVACSTHKEGSELYLRHCRSAGLQCACVSSGVIVQVGEVYGTESISQRYFFLADLLERYPELQVVVHDDACHVYAFALRRRHESALAATLAALKYRGDIFHSGGHIDPWCIANTHPDLPDTRALLADVRTSVCEFTFTWLSRFRFQTGHMSEYGFNFFMTEMIDCHNYFVLTGDRSHLTFLRRERTDSST